jgi:hypothetical protein
VVHVNLTPIGIIESYFDRPLERSALKTYFAQVTEDEWIDFAKQYLALMRADFAGQFLRPREHADRTLRLYFEPRLSQDWDSAVVKRYARTPLLGSSASPPDEGTVTRASVSKLLDPLKKHLLLADSVYLRDSFYYCFDAVADSVNRSRWRSDPNSANLVRDSIRRIKGWLPMLIELRELIETNALVFMPYYLTPSFPYGSNAPAIGDHLKRLRMRRDPDAKGRPPAPNFDFALLTAQLRGEVPWPEWNEDRTTERFSEEDTLTAWLNARILDLDPVFPSAAMSGWASNLYFDEGPTSLDVTSDLISVSVLPFGGTEGIGLDDLLSMRKNERVFAEIQHIVAGCKAYLEANINITATRETTTALCKTYLQDKLAEHEQKSVLRVLKYADEKPAAGIVVSLAVGAALTVAAGPAAAGVIAGALLTPQVARAVQRKVDPTQRAFGHLQALL